MRIKKLFQGKRSFNSASYWEERYAKGRTSGEGSYGKLAEFKAQVLNQFVVKNNINTVIEYGCGDGNQLKLANYPSYIGFDVSRTAVERCRNFFRYDKTKRFELINNYKNETSELTLSLDVIYHLVEDYVFDEYMTRLFSSSSRFVIIYSNDIEQGAQITNKHVRFRRFSEWVNNNAKDWDLKEIKENKLKEASAADFFIYEKRLSSSK